MKVILIPVILFFLSPLGGSAQKHTRFTSMEDTLLLLSGKVSKAKDDSLKLKLNLAFQEKLKYVLDQPGSFEYPFDSLKNLGKIISPDKKFRIYNWNIPLTDGSNRYFAFIHLQKGKKETKVIPLKDYSDSLADPEMKILNKDTWFGALYYKVIVEKSGKKDIYTLLGWDGFSPENSRKLIEILTFDLSGNPVFGARIFGNYRKGRNTRVFFQYEASTAMLLRFDEQMVPIGKKWNPSKKKYESGEEKLPLIIFDHLVPSESKADGQSMASSDLYDGFIFRNGTWNFVPGVDARNR